MHKFSFQTLFLVFPLIIVQVFAQNDVENVIPRIESSLSTVETTVSNITEELNPNPQELNKTSQSPNNTTKIISPLTPEPPIVPTPLPFPKNIGYWTVNYTDTNRSCIMLQGAFQIQCSDKNLTTIDTEQIINVPKEAAAKGVCKNSTQSLDLEWYTSDQKYSLEFTFEKNITTASYELHQIKFHWISTNSSETNNENRSNGTVSIDGTYFSTHLNRSFMCTAEQTITGDLQVHTADLQFEAFKQMEDQKNAFSDPQLCSTDTSRAVTVIGIVLGSLLLVLAAIGVGMFIGVRYGYFSFPCCKRTTSGYQRLDI